MTFHTGLIDKLRSSDSDTRYQACEELRVEVSLPAQALAALRRATHDPNAEVADAASRALAAHARAPAAPESQPAPSTIQSSLDDRRASLFKALSDGLQWFSVIAALSIYASYDALQGDDVDTFFGHVLGLGITQSLGTIVLALRKNLQIELPWGPGPYLLAALALAGVFYAYGWMGRHGNRLAVIGGIALYAFDAILTLASGQWFALAWHALGLWVLWKGLQAMTTMTRLQEAQSSGDSVSLQEVLASLPPVPPPTDPVTRRTNLAGFAVIAGCIVPILLVLLFSWLASR